MLLKYRPAKGSGMLSLVEVNKMDLYVYNSDH